MKGILFVVAVVALFAAGCKDVVSFDGGNDAEAKAAFDAAVPPGYEIVIRRIGEPGPCAPATDVADALKPTPAQPAKTRSILPTKSAESKPAAPAAPAAKPATKVAAAEEAAPATPPTADK